MKRFVSYLYSIYNNQKIHNAGFARMELRTGRNRVDIHLKENGYAGKTGTVYLFIRKQENIQGISIGNITFRGNQADFRYEQAEENIGQTPWQIIQMNGILIIMDDRAAFLSQWDEQPVDTTRFEIWNVDKLEAAIPSGKTGDEKIITPPIQTEDKEMATPSIQTEDQKVPAPAIRTENKEMPAMPDQTEDQKVPVPAIRTGSKEMPAMPDRTEDQQKVPAAAIQTEDKKIPSSEIASEDQTEPPARSGEGSPQPKKEGAFSSEQTMDIQTAELQPQVRNQWNQTWRYMLRRYPVLNQFTNNNKVLCVRIEIKDVRLLPEKYWSMVNNSFLLHGFFNYRYLVFGRIDQNWFIGIPGIYQNQEHVMASIFGFPDFLPQNQKNERGEQPGYWYRVLEI